jgi:hypothetical protein
MAKRITSFGHGDGDPHGYGCIDGYGYGAGHGCIDGYGYGNGDGRGHGDGRGYDGRGYMGGYGYGYKGGSGNGYWYGSGHGCIDGHGYGDGYGYGYMDGYECGCGYGYGYGEISQTQLIGEVSGYQIDFVILFGLVRVGCKMLSKEQWREIAENNNTSIDETEVRLILEKCQAYDSN